MILEIMDKLFKVQLPIQVLIASLHYFLENKSKALSFSTHTGFFLSLVVP